MASTQSAEQITSWAPPISLAEQTELIDRSRIFWAEGGQFVPNTLATGEFNDPYDDIHHLLSIDPNAPKGHTGRLLAEEHALCMESTEFVGKEAQEWFGAAGFEQVSKSGRFLVPENVAGLTITDVLTQRVARVSRAAIVSALPGKTAEDSSTPFITVGPKLLVRTFDTRQPKRVEVFQGEAVHPSKVFAWSLLRNAVTVEYTPEDAEAAA